MVCPLGSSSVVFRYSLNSFNQGRIGSFGVDEGPEEPSESESSLESNSRSSVLNFETGSCPPELVVEPFASR
jgi:hypothetical protein